MPLLFTSFGRIFGIPTIMEMANLYPHPAVRPDIVVADSLYGLCHRSMRHLTATTAPSPCRGFDQSHVLAGAETGAGAGAGGTVTRGLVIAPGVDVSALQLAALKYSAVCDPGCGEAALDPAVPLFSRLSRVRHRCSQCFTIGVVCRMSKVMALAISEQ
jgi:hypothetical protein